MSGTGLYIAVGFGGQIIDTKDLPAFNAEFFRFADAGSNSGNNDKYAVFAPDGHRVEQGDGRRRWSHRPGHGQRGAKPEVVYNNTGWPKVGTADVLVSTWDSGPILTAHVIDQRLPGDRQGIGDPIPAFRRDSHPTAQYDHGAHDHQ